MTEEMYRKVDKYYEGNTLATITKVERFTTLEAAKSMLEHGIPSEEIMKITKLTPEEMQNLDSLIGPLKEEVRRMKRDCALALDQNHTLGDLRWAAQTIRNL